VPVRATHRCFRRQLASSRRLRAGRWQFVRAAR
jgi:hypothetical protein